MENGGYRLVGRIIFLNCFPRDLVSGGIKTMYRHALLLRQAGFHVQVLQAEGVPSWLGKEMHPLMCETVTNLTRQDIFVFPEVLREWYADMISTPMIGQKVIFCQNPYYFFTYGPSAQKLAEWGVTQVLAPGIGAAHMLQRVLGLENVQVTPPVVDGNLFRPRQKKLQVVCAEWKWPQQGGLPRHAVLIQDMLKLKYPQFSSVPWVPLQERKEEEVAALMGESAVCLSLGRLEALGITALEAMAAGCLVVGCHGGGGSDYATSQNGFWHSPEDVEGMVDSLAMALEGCASGSGVIRKMVAQGQAAAQPYAPDKVSMRLQQVYGQLWG
ncbi:hypothetical protein AL01_07155 [Bombella intestini]|uniref:Glycosyl transferase family 1 domain-containing protein n=1 Tax=Bombella intestini TaxID=1539051 RepID=A0A1S8GPA0_9PROT|nr:glycosyltransferase [Bombella intestini]OOL17746.1 hypothetical protein AL01_07155 [Bombella intestini]